MDGRASDGTWLRRDIVMRDVERSEAGLRRDRARVVPVAGALLAGGLLVLGVATAASAQTAPPPVAPPAVVAPQRAFAPAFEGVVEGDLLLVGNSNLLAAGAVRVSSRNVADVDGDATALCATRLFVPGGCDDNSSSSDLTLPTGARVVEARLYVATTLARNATSVVARLDGPAAAAAVDLGPTSAGIPKLWEATGTGATGSLMRQAVWDVTDYVAANGGGAYTVADIVNDPGLSAMPYASWALAVVYEFDPSSGVDRAALPPAEQQRFARRAIAWHDGFVVQTADDQTADDLEVDLAIEVPTPAVPFAKSYHLVAHGGSGAFDNLVLNGQPLGNSATPGNAVPPPGVVVGADLACNDVTDVFNDSICVLGTPVATKSPGADEYTASTGARTATSGSGVDIDVSRIPDRYLESAAIEATMGVLSGADRTLAPGLLALSIDLVAPAADPTAATTTTAAQP